MSKFPLSKTRTTVTEIFPVNELPEQNKGKGVILQRYKDGTLSDIKVISENQGLTWSMQGGRKREEKGEYIA